MEEIIWFLGFFFLLFLNSISKKKNSREDRRNNIGKRLIIIKNRVRSKYIKLFMLFCQTLCLSENFHYKMFFKTMSVYQILIWLMVLLVVSTSVKFVIQMICDIVKIMKIKWDKVFSTGPKTQKMINTC